MRVEKFTQVDTVSNQVGFFHGDDSQQEDNACRESTPRKQWLQRGDTASHEVGKSHTHRCKYGRHPGRSLYTLNQTLAVLSWLWKVS
jgi:hypothetical protein